MVGGVAESDSFGLVDVDEASASVAGRGLQSAAIGRSGSGGVGQVLGFYCGPSLCEVGQGFGFVQDWSFGEVGFRDLV